MTGQWERVQASDLKKGDRVRKILVGTWLPNEMGTDGGFVVYEEHYFEKDMAADHAASLAKWNEERGLIKEYPDLYLELIDYKNDEDLAHLGICLTGCLPGDYPSHYDVEAVIQKRQPNARFEQFDSESGQFFVYPDNPLQADEWVEIIRSLKGMDEDEIYEKILT